jgi:hypothetical protein
MFATEHIDLIRGLPPQVPDHSAEFCRQSLHRTLAHLVACQRAWLPLVQAIIDGKTRARVKPHPLRLMETSGLLNADWTELTAEYASNAHKWALLSRGADPEHQMTVGHRSWTVTELTGRLIDHERHHLAEHGLPAAQD